MPTQKNKAKSNAKVLVLNRNVRKPKSQPQKTTKAKAKK
jgi:hypothetical protein